MTSSGPRTALAALAGVAALGGVTACLPIIAAASGGFGGDSGQQVSGCGQDGELTPISDGTPSILGPTTLTHSDLLAWWESTGTGQPPMLSIHISDLIALYLTEATVEGVRGDLAFTQAVHETGHFTSRGTADNNFAGIAHYDGQSSGRTFPDAPTGVRAHIQLLAKYAGGNDVDLVNPDVAPRAGATARTWGELAGTWATDTSYWDRLDSLYQAMAEHADPGQPANGPQDIPNCLANDTDRLNVATSLTEIRGITVHEDIADQIEALLDAAEADELTLTGSGYRSPDEQIELRRQHCGDTDYAIYQMPSSQCSPPTARPGTSMHERGLAIDFDNCSDHETDCYRWLSAHAADYGLYNLPSEPWHWSTSGA